MFGVQNLMKYIYSQLKSVKGEIQEGVQELLPTRYLLKNVRVDPRQGHWPRLFKAEDLENEMTGWVAM